MARGRLTVRVYKPIPPGTVSTVPGYPADRDDAGEADADHVPPGQWAIDLPHQCDAWAIAMSPDREVVLAEGRRFRGELDAAIAEVEAGQAARVPLVHHGDRITGERNTSRCLDWQDGDTSSRDATEVTCTACQNEVFP